MRPATQIVDHPPLEPKYREELILRLRQELRRSPRHFQDLVRRAEGAYPLDVLSALHFLESDESVGVLASQLALEVRHPENWPERQRCIHYPEIADNLPEPHPLDFDWRFSRNTLTLLCQEINALSSDNVAVLGAPTLFKSLRDSGVNAHLFDKNQSVIQHLKGFGYPSVTHCDLFTFHGIGDHFQSAVADPPWYLEHYHAFLKASRSILAPEGKLFLSVLPRLTRPSAANDRVEVVEFAANFGFDLIEVKPARLHYVSPPFELEALKADGLALQNWRSGDLFSFILRSRPVRESKIISPPDHEDWKTIKLGKTTIRIKQESSTGDSLGYRTVSPTGGIRLRSVSRRSPVRSEITVWSSRNIALNVSKTVPLAEALKRIEIGEAIGGALAGVTYQYHLSAEETARLREMVELLVRDAELAWNA